MATNDGVLLDCNCEGRSGLNEMKQKASDVRRMQNPIVLRFVATRPTMTYRNNKRTGTEGENDIDTTFIYHFGGTITHQCVDERDVQRLLVRRFANARLFVKEQNHIQPKAADVVSGEDVLELPATTTDPFATPQPPVVKPDNAPELVAELTALEGIGEATATKLVQTGHTLEFLGNLEPEPTVLAQIAEAATVAPALVGKAITGAKEALDNGD